MTGVIFIFGSAYLCYTIYLEENFFASPPQLIGTAVAVILLVIIAFTIRRSHKPPTAGFVPSPWIVAGFSLVMSSLFMLADTLPGWTKVAAGILTVVIFFAAVFHWARRIGWSAMHRLALAGGGILTYAWLGLLMEPESGSKVIFDYIGSTILAAFAIVLLRRAAGKVRKFAITS